MCVFEIRSLELFSYRTVNTVELIVRTYFRTRKPGIIRCYNAQPYLVVSSDNNLLSTFTSVLRSYMYFRNLCNEDNIVSQAIMLRVLIIRFTFRRQRRRLKYTALYRSNFILHFRAHTSYFSRLYNGRYVNDNLRGYFILFAL